MSIIVSVLARFASSIIICLHNCFLVVHNYFCLLNKL